MEAHMSMSWRAMLGIYAFAAVVFAAMMGYGFPYVIERKTDINEREIVITRGIGFGTTLTYAKNRVTGDEKVIFNQLVPFLAKVYYVVDYSASCQCIKDVYRNEWDDSFSIHPADEGVRVTTGKLITISKKVPIEEVQGELNWAKFVLDGARSRFAGILPQ